MERATDVDERARIVLGRLGEDAALRWYTERGYTLVARNWRCRLGELDLVLRRGDELVVCEVKARRGAAYGGPFEAVTGRKRRKLEALAEVFLATTNVAPSSVRFDVASVAMPRSGPVRGDVHVFEEAF
jgi:putative endonuclease